jgi:hypothetical protein
MFSGVDNGVQGVAGGCAASLAFQISANIDRSVVWNKDAVNRAIRRPAGPCRTSSSRFRRDLPFMAFEVLQPLSTSEASGRSPSAVADQIPTTLVSWPKVVEKPAEMLLQIAGAKSADLARGRFSPYRSPPHFRRRRQDPCIAVRS